MVASFPKRQRLSDDEAALEHADGHWQLSAIVGRRPRRQRRTRVRQDPARDRRNQGHIGRDRERDPDRRHIATVVQQCERIPRTVRDRSFTERVPKLP